MYALMHIQRQKHGDCTFEAAEIVSTCIHRSGYRRHAVIHNRAQTRLHVLSEHVIAQCERLCTPRVRRLVLFVSSRTCLQSRRCFDQFMHQRCIAFDCLCMYVCVYVYVCVAVNPGTESMTSKGHVPNADAASSKIVFEND
jgi:hypothetical protein